LFAAKGQILLIVLPNNYKQTIKFLKTPTNQFRTVKSC
jgi:hypothetical protein